MLSKTQRILKTPTENQTGIRKGFTERGNNDWDIENNTNDSLEICDYIAGTMALLLASLKLTIYKMINLLISLKVCQTIVLLVVSLAVDVANAGAIL